MQGSMVSFAATRRAPALERHAPHASTGASMPVSARVPRARFAWLSLAVLLVAVVAGCTLKSGGYNTVSPPKIRFFNAGMDIGSIDVTIGTIAIAGGLNFEVFTSYATAQTGPQDITISLSGTTTPFVQTTQSFSNGDRFSYVLYGRAASPQTILVSDAEDLPGGGKTKIRLINAATEQGPLDFYVTNPGTDLTNEAPTITGITLGAASPFVEIDAGSRELRITPTGSKSVLWDSGQVNLADRNAYNFVAYSRGNPRLVNVGLMTLDTLGSGTLQPSTLTDVRLVNATPATPLVDMLVDGNVHIGSVAYGVASNYQADVGGSHTVSFQPTGQSTTLLSGSLTFPPGGASTIALVGAAGAQQSFVLQDLNFLPITPTNARIRVVNLRSDAGSFETFVNGTLVVGTLAPELPSLYFELPAATYTFAFVDPSTSATVLQESINVAAGHTYSVFVMGTSDALRDVVTLDR